MYAEYVLDSYGVEVRKRNQVVLCPVKMGDKIMHKRDAQRLLQPHFDRVNCSLATPTRERKSATFEGFAVMWERDYLSLSKPSTQSSTRSYLKRLKAAFGKKDMRQIGAGDIQRLISASISELDPKTIRNMWGTVSLIWDVALAQKYVTRDASKTEAATQTEKETEIFHSRRGQQNHCGLSG